MTQGLALRQTLTQENSRVRLGDVVHIRDPIGSQIFAHRNAKRTLLRSSSIFEPTDQ